MHRNQELQLIELGRRTVNVAVYKRREDARKRRIVQAVNRHLHGSAADLQQALHEAAELGHGEPTADEFDSALRSLTRNF